MTDYEEYYAKHNTNPYWDGGKRVKTLKESTKEECSCGEPLVEDYEIEFSYCQWCLKTERIVEFKMNQRLDRLEAKIDEILRRKDDSQA